MGERAEALARQFERMNDAFIATVEGCPEERWSARCPDTGWPANVQAHHIAGGLALFPPMLAAIVEGDPAPPLDLATMNERNAKHAADYAQVTKENVLADLHRNGAVAAAWIRGLSDAELDRTGTVAAGMPAFSVAQLVQFGLMGEMERHGGSLREAIGAA